MGVDQRSRKYLFRLKTRFYPKTIFMAMEPASFFPSSVILCSPYLHQLCQACRILLFMVHRNRLFNPLIKFASVHSGTFNQRSADRIQKWDFRPNLQYDSPQFAFNWFFSFPMSR